jgi:membrane-anchored protein YejM (alkaline phosphatase superfamily)
MPDSNLENQLKVDSNPGVKDADNQERKDRHQDWFSCFLKYQAQSKSFFEYIITEAENGRQ